MKAALFSSPGCASTVAPSSPIDRFRLLSDGSEISGDDDYQKMPELALPASSAEQPLVKGSSGSSKKFGAAAAFWISISALAVVGVFVMNLLIESNRPKIKIWNPDLRQEFSTEPLAKSVIRKFDAYNMARGGRDNQATFNANVKLYMEPDMLYESVGFGTWRTPAGWSAGEETNYGAAFPETIFTQMLFFGNEEIATTTTYGSALWSGDLWGIKGPGQWVTLRITDFYYIKPYAPGLGKISYNFMMIDWVDALRQIGRRMLPPAPLQEGLVLPPAANDGVPAPLSAIVQAQHRDPKAAHAVAEAALFQDWTGVGDTLSHWHANMTYYGPGGIGHASNISQYMQHVIQPFRAAFTDRKALVELHACEGNYCALFGRLSGHGVSNWLGLPTKGQDVSFRYAMHYRVMGDKVQEGWTIFDFPGLFAEVGLDFYKLAASGGRL
jgi:predicted ester cyclase